MELLHRAYRDSRRQGRVAVQRHQSGHGVRSLRGHRARSRVHAPDGRSARVEDRDVGEGARHLRTPQDVDVARGDGQGGRRREHGIRGARFEGVFPTRHATRTARSNYRGVRRRRSEWRRVGRRRHRLAVGHCVVLHTGRQCCGKIFSLPLHSSSPPPSARRAHSSASSTARRASSSSKRTRRAERGCVRNWCKTASSGSAGNHDM